ncbi:unnamed protein product [Dibothriocephalus latus]|uniref:Uncharacterized protein n=1 Tax=Dibothriocephalus latus TaxID=60516 RepID=A0A3P7NDT1_DIBLA|nr:unnamed protein product [Dibothriocephalus latus]
MPPILTHLLDPDSKLSPPRRRPRHQPKNNSTAYSNSCHPLVHPPASFASNTSTKSPSAVQVRRCSPEDTERNTCPTDSSVCWNLSETSLATPYIFSVFGFFIQELFSGACRFVPWTHQRAFCLATYDLKDNFVESGVVNINSALALPMMLNQEASTDVDLVLLSNIDSDGGGSINSMNWTSVEFISSPVEMRLHGPLLVWNSEEQTATRQVEIIIWSSG